MRFFTVTSDTYILSVGTGNGGTEITEDEYNAILAVIRNKPPATETTDYRLREDLTWEAYPIDPPDPDPEIDDAEVYNILFGGGV
jgi:hypothetical protein